MAFGIPSSQDLTDAGVKLEDHAAVQGKALIDYLLSEVNESLRGAVNSIANIESKTALDVQAIIGGLDGWTLTIEPITIRLTKPRKETNDEKPQ